MYSLLFYNGVYSDEGVEMGVIDELMLLMEEAASTSWIKTDSYFTELHKYLKCVRYLCLTIL